MENETKHTVIIDQIGRNIVGELVSDDDKTITLNNPVIVHVQPEHDPQTGQPTGQLQVNTFPVFFFEFIDPDHRERNHWTWDKSSIALGSVELAEKVKMQYEKINVPQEPKADDSKPNVIKIDDL